MKSTFDKNVEIVKILLIYIEFWIKPRKYDLFKKSYWFVVALICLAIVANFVENDSDNESQIGVISISIFLIILLIDKDVET